MDDRRFDELLQAALRTGAIPPSATPEEREEILRALPMTDAIRRAQAPLDTEARAAMPIARARFERFMDASSRSAPAPVQAAGPRRGLLHGLLTVRRSAAGFAALLVVVAGAALFGSQLTGNESTAAALTPGDYVQIEGIVAESHDGSADIDSAVGNVGIDLVPDTSVLEGDQPREANAIRKGAGVVVSGVVTPDGRVKAQTVAVSDAAARPPRITIRELRELRPNLSGRVVTFMLSEDQKRARALIETADGTRYLVPIDAASTERLLRLTTTLGARVEVEAAPGGAAGVFSLKLNGPPRPGGDGPVPEGSPQATRGAVGPPAERPGLVQVTGIVLGRTGLQLEVETRRGVASVRVTRATRVVFSANSGITRADFDRGEPIRGHAVTVTGGIDKASGAVIADVILIGARAPGR